MGLTKINSYRQEKQRFCFFCLAPTGEGISGSDRIFIELARQWSKSIPVTIYTTQEGINMCEKQELVGKYLKVKKLESRTLPSNFFMRYLYKIILGIKLGFSSQYAIYNIQYTNMYSSSDFWMDVIPAVILKTRYPKIKWIATWYQTAPNPISGYEEHKNIKTKRQKKYNFSALLYWLSQLPIKPLIKKYADFVIVNNEDERKQFPVMDKKGKVFVLLGAVRLKEIENWKLKIGNLPKVYDAVFQGRFHPQKGVVELIDIWKKVCDKIPNAKLAMIGNGPLWEDVISRIVYHRLQDNIKLFGYVFDGPEKYTIFAQSKIVVHPALYDSGGMAASEAMVFGLPCVGFNLKAYRSYYSQGMVKVETGNLNDFALGVINLLVKDSLRKKIGENAKKIIKREWSWETRANNAIQMFTNAK